MSVVIKNCLHCGEPLNLPEKRGRGRPRLYCKIAHAKAAWNARQRAKAASAVSGETITQPVQVSNTGTNGNKRVNVTNGSAPETSPCA